jgi:diguanylate cyclase (GGDEF)-like protein
MNVQVFIPLGAAIAYIPLFVILISNRPWDRKERLFFLFLVSTFIWSFGDIFFRGSFLIEYKLVIGKVILCIVIWMLVQFHYFLRSFHESQPIKIPFAYGFLAITIVLAIRGYIPRNVEVTANGVNVDYGPWILIIGLLILFTLGTKNIVSLLRRYRISPDPAERNRILYLFIALAILIVFLFGTIFIPRGGEYPIGHLGNWIIACVLTYAVLAHHLVDVRVIFRRLIGNLVLYAGGIALILLFFLMAHLFFGFQPDFTTLGLAIGLGIPVVVFMIYKVREPWRSKLDEAFIGERYSHRRQLSDFITKIHSVPTLKELGSDFISLIAQSLACQRSCLLLPEVGTGSFNTRFVYPPAEDNPIGKLELRQDSPVVTWLKREKTILPKENLAIFPEFQSIWQEEREEIKLAGVEIFVPLMNRGELVAVLAVSERRDRKLYGVEDIDLLESIADQVAASMEKEYFHEQLQEQDKEITLINRLTTIITSSVSIQKIFEGFVQELKKVVDVDWASIALIDGNELYLSALSTTIGSAWQTGERITLEGTATEWVCRERKSWYEADLAQYRRFWTGEHYLQHGIRSVVYLPLAIKDDSIGSLIVASRHPNAFTTKKIRLLEQVALQIATPIENSQLYARAEQRARIDELTGLFNRRHFEERLKEEIARHARYSDIFSIFLLDLDNFKTYNDIYGHPSGDILLNQTGKIIRSSVRSADQAFRYGGDEFVVILPHTTMDDAWVVADRVRQAIAEEMEKREIDITCSIGLASYPSDGVMSGELITVADTALYFAKRTGGNRVYLSSKILSESQDNAGTYARRNGLSAIYALVSTVEAKDPYTYGHSRKVNTYAVALAEAIGLSPEEVSRVSTAALLHDIGKIGVPDKVLNKKGKLNTEDWEAIKAHPRLGATIIGNVPNLVPCVSIILHHHERWDGSGYPEGLKGEEIPIESRILAIADSFEAMSSARPYRPALCGEKVLKQLRHGAGSQFDPELVEIFIGIIEAGFPEGVKTGQDSTSEGTGP